MGCVQTKKEKQHLNLESPNNHQSPMTSPRILQIVEEGVLSSREIQDYVIERRRKASSNSKKSVSKRKASN